MSVSYYNRTKTARPERVVAGQSIFRRQSRGMLAFVGVFVLFIAFAGVMNFMPKKPEIAVVLGAGLALTLSIIRWPMLGTYMLVVMPILFDGFPSEWATTPISEAGVFRNLSYRGLPQFVYISIFEVIVVLTLASVLVKRFHTHQYLDRGPLYRPLLMFGGIVMMGEFIGLLSTDLGLQSVPGDFKITLWEVRPLLYIVLLYLVTVNTIKTPRHVRIVLWIVMLSTLARCFEGVYRYYKMTPDIREVAPVILEHDDSLFLVVAVGLVVAAIVWRNWLHKRFLWVALALLPFSFYMMDLNGRRAVYMSVVIMLVAFVPMLWNAMRSQQQRKRFARGLVITAILAAAYLAVFWNKEGGIAAPAASVRSVFQPSERDYLSNLYRDQENTNLKYTISFSPIVGIGFGRPFQVIEPMVDLTKEWAFQFYMPHNNMLWLWMRMGIIGFVMFWVVVGGTILLAAACMRLGVARLRMLVEQEQSEYLVSHPLKHKQTKSANAELSGMNYVRCKASRSVAESASQETPLEKRKTTARRMEMRECAEFLVLVMVTLATVISLVGLAVVDQGLMSFRLSSFAGLMMGAMAAGWSMYKVKYRVPAEMKVDELPEQEGIVVARRRMRSLVGA
jgi:hypothetical protein